MLSVVFFFQAEDGIRDLVRSRGLGDVYKRQGLGIAGVLDVVDPRCWQDLPAVAAAAIDHELADSVSYTHLTLPTSDLV